MKTMVLKFSMLDDFQVGECNECPLYNDETHKCQLLYRWKDCPLEERIINETEEDCEIVD